jgi:ferritin-like metal-binding protein YciE
VENTEPQNNFTEFFDAMDPLRGLFLTELEDAYDAEKRIIRALPKLIQAATCNRLKELLQSHLEETEGQITRLEKVFKSFGARAKGKKCEAVVGLLKESDEIAEEFKGSFAVNAALIAAGQKVEHYEIASYGCLHEWAKLLGNDSAARLLQVTLREEKDADKKLTKRARATSNDEAKNALKPGEKLSGSRGNGMLTRRHRTSLRKARSTRR